MFYLLFGEWRIIIIIFIVLFLFGEIIVIIIIFILFIICGINDNNHYLYCFTFLWMVMACLFMFYTRDKSLCYWRICINEYASINVFVDLFSEHAVAIAPRYRGQLPSVTIHFNLQPRTCSIYHGKSNFRIFVVRALTLLLLSLQVLSVSLLSVFVIIRF